MEDIGRLPSMTVPTDGATNILIVFLIFLFNHLQSGSLFEGNMWKFVCATTQTHSLFN
jgi:hypothetical protein